MIDDISKNVLIDNYGELYGKKVNLCLFVFLYIFEGYVLLFFFYSDR